MVETGFGFCCEIYAEGTVTYGTLETETPIDGALETWNRLDAIWETGNVTIDFVTSKCLDLHFDCRKNQTEYAFCLFILLLNGCVSLQYLIKEGTIPSSASPTAVPAS